MNKIVVIKATAGDCGFNLHDTPRLARALGRPELEYPEVGEYKLGRKVVVFGRPFPQAKKRKVVARGRTLVVQWTGTHRVVNLV